MLLTIQTGTLFSSLGESVALDVIKEAGFDGVDFSFCYFERGGFDPRFDGNFLDYAKKIRALLDERGLVCHQAHAPMAMRYSLAFDEGVKEYQDIVHSIESAGVLGADYLVLHPIRTPESEDYLEYNARFYSSFEETLKKAGVKMAAENIYAFLDEKVVGKLSTPEEMKDLLRRLGEENFALCFDVGHATIVGEDPSDFILSLGDKLSALHIHDNDGSRDLHTLMGEGVLDFEKVVSALRKINFKGAFNLEIDGYLRSLPQDELKSAVFKAGEIARQIISR